MPSRISLILQATTAPTDGTAAIPHTGGWTEGFWQLGDIASDDPKIVRLATKRAILLPIEAAIVGYRIGLYTIVGNALMPRGTSVGKQLFPGNGGYSLNLPQDALELSGKTADGPNSSRFMLRALPDGMVTAGEYQPTSTFKTAVTLMGQNLVADAWGWVGRNLTNSLANILAYDEDTDSWVFGPGFTAVTGDFVRLIDATANGVNISGSYRVTAQPQGAASATLAGLSLTADTSNVSGKARTDSLRFLPFTVITPSRARVKKIGRPFESYRGRRSNRA